MEVTRANFQEVLEELDGVLKDATFLAIDAEFTGLNSGPEANPFDTLSQYYAKLRSGSMDFLMVQFGLSVFTRDAKTDKYSQRSYNFYVFPRPLNKSAPDCRFMCQASSIAFLSDRGFDFNKLFNEGIPYLTTVEEERMKKKMEERWKMREDGLELIPISDGDKPQIEEICSRIDEFLASDAEELAIDRCNAFIRRLIHQEARMRWPNAVRLEAKTEGGSQMLYVYKKGTKDEEKKREIEKREKEKQELKNAVGLTELLRKIADSGKVMVGHNMLLDICHMTNQFFGTLPESYREFKSLIHGLFPRLFDTKLISQSPQLKDKVPTSILDAIFETVSKAPFTIPDIEPIEGRSYSTSVKLFHEAGYDAYITGLCFITLSNYLGSLKQSTSTTVLPDSPLLNQFLNKLLIIRLKDIPYINLVGTDPTPSRDHVFHITFPKEWKWSDVSHLFSPFGGAWITWLTETTAYVSLYQREQASTLMKNLAKNKRMRDCKIQTYAEHQDSMNEEVEEKVDRKRKSPNDGATAKTETSKIGDDSANGVDNSREDGGWEMAAGNRNKTVSGVYKNSDKQPATSSASQAIFPFLNEELSRRLDNVLRREVIIDCNEVFRSREAAEPLYSSLAEADVLMRDINAYRKAQCDEVNRARGVFEREKKNLSTNASGGKARKSPKRRKSAALSLPEKSSINETSKNNTNSRYGTSYSRDEMTVRKRLVAGNENYDDKVQLKSPSLKLLRSTKRKSEPVLTTSLLIRFAQIIAVLILVCVIFFWYRSTRLRR